MAEAVKKTQSFPLRMPPTLRSRVERLAVMEGVSLNQFITLTLAEKLGASIEQEYFADKRRNANFETLLKTLNREGGEAPRLGDEILTP